MRNIIDVTIGKEFKGKRLKDYLKDDLKFSSRLIKNLIKGDYIFINRKRSRTDYIIKGGERLSVLLDKEESMDIAEVKMDLDIVYEDSSLIILNKPSGIIVHPTKSHQDDTLANGILWHFKQNNDVGVVRFISRIDRDTTGLVMVAKNQFVHSYFSRFGHGGSLKKEYLAIVEGKMPEDNGTIDLPISKEGLENYRRYVTEDGLEARTNYSVLLYSEGYSIVRFSLETGRTHQIRVHTSHIGHPIVNDPLYGGKTVDESCGQFLHAWKVSYPDPISGENMSHVADLPKHMIHFINSVMKTDISKLT